MAFVPLEKLHRLEEGYSRCFRVAGREILLLVDAGRTYLLDAVCPHAGASLARGSIQNGCLRCPKHGIQFELCSGRAVGGEAVAMVPPLKQYLPAYRENEIGLDLEE